MTDAGNPTQGLSDEDLGRLLCCAPVPAPSADFMNRIVSEAARHPQKLKAWRRLGGQPESVRRAVWRGSIVFGAVTVAAAAAALTAVHGDFRRLPELPTMILHPGRRTSPMVAPLAVAKPTPLAAVPAAPPALETPPIATAPRESPAEAVPPPEFARARAAQPSPRIERPTRPHHVDFARSAAKPSLEVARTPMTENARVREPQAARADGTGPDRDSHPAEIKSQAATAEHKDLEMDRAARSPEPVASEHATSVEDHRAEQPEIGAANAKAEPGAAEKNKGKDRNRPWRRPLARRGRF